MSGLVGNIDVDRVREAVDLVALIGEHVPLKPKGREHVGLCPFHDDHSPSMTVVTHKGSAFYKCHSCGAAGDAFNFVMDYHKMAFPEALQLLADRTGITLSRRPGAGGRAQGPDRSDLRRANAVAAEFYREHLNGGRGAAAARAMVRDRGISDQTAEVFAIGAAPDQWESLARAVSSRGVSAAALAAAGLTKSRDAGQGTYDTFRNRLIFPICDELGRPVAFGGRRIDPADEPKYLNSPESPLFSKSRTLYGLHLARRAIIDAGRVIVTEGYTDVVACHQAGISNAVATLGTALTRDHARVLKRLCDEVLLVFDGDEAGQRAADRAVELFFAEAVDVKICVLPGGHDPADLLAQAEGPRIWEAAIEGAQDALEYKVSRFRSQLNAVEGMSARRRILAGLLEELSALGFHSMSGVDKRPVIAQLAHLLGARIDDIEKALPGRRRPGRPAAAGAADAAGEPPAAAESLWQDSALVPPARRRAERELLALLIYQPSLRTQPVATAEAPHRSVQSLLEPKRFSDPAARRVAEIVGPWLGRDQDFTVPQLMAELDDPRLRKLIGDLFLEAQQCLDQGPSPSEHLREVCASLDRLLSKERYEQDLDAYRQTADGERRTEVLRNVLQERRKQGYIPEAIPSRVRT